jgi:hypothetical protein
MEPIVLQEYAVQAERLVAERRSAPAATRRRQESCSASLRRVYASGSRSGSATPAPRSLRADPHQKQLVVMAGVGLIDGLHWARSGTAVLGQ